MLKGIFRVSWFLFVCVYVGACVHTSVWQLGLECMKGKHRSTWQDIQRWSSENASLFKVHYKAHSSLSPWPQAPPLLYYAKYILQPQRAFLTNNHLCAFVAGCRGYRSVRYDWLLLVHSSRFIGTALCI